MKKLIFLFAMIASMTAQAQNLGAQTLSFNDFLRLDGEDRADYIEALRLNALQSEKDLDTQNKTPRATSLNQLFLQTLLGRAFATAGDTCIYAGYISQMDAQDICQAPVALTQKVWSIHNGNQTKNQQLCVGSGQVLCNPLLYGFGPDAAGICTTNHSRPTADCEKQYQAIPNYKARNVADQLVASGLKNDFDTQATKLNDYCSGTQSARQTSICKNLKQKTSYMQAKIQAAEQRQKNPTPVELPVVVKHKKKTAPVVAAPTPELAPRAVASVGGGVSSPEFSGSPSADNAVAISSSVDAPLLQEARATSADIEAASTATTDKAKPKLAKKELSKDGCIRNNDDYQAYKSKLPKPLQSVDKAPFYISQDDWMVAGAFKVSFVGGKLKISTALWATASDIVKTEVYVSAVCLDPQNPNKVVLKTPPSSADAKAGKKFSTSYIDFSGGKIVVGSGKQSHGFNAVNVSEYNRVSNKVSVENESRAGKQAVR